MDLREKEKNYWYVKSLISQQRQIIRKLKNRIMDYGFLKENAISLSISLSLLVGGVLYVAVQQTFIYFEKKKPLATPTPEKITPSTPEEITPTPTPTPEIITEEITPEIITPNELVTVPSEIVQQTWSFYINGQFYVVNLDPEVFVHNILHIIYTHDLIGLFTDHHQINLYYITYCHDLKLLFVPVVYSFFFIRPTLVIEKISKSLFSFITNLRDIPGVPFEYFKNHSLLAFFDDISTKLLPQPFNFAYPKLLEHKIFRKIDFTHLCNNPRFYEVFFKLESKCFYLHEITWNLYFTYLFNYTEFTSSRGSTRIQQFINHFNVAWIEFIHTAYPQLNINKKVDKVVSRLQKR